MEVKSEVIIMLKKPRSQKFQTIKSIFQILENNIKKFPFKLQSNLSQTSSNATKSFQQKQSISRISAWHFPPWHHPIFPPRFCRDLGWLFPPTLSGLWPHWKLLAWFCFSGSNWYGCKFWKWLPILRSPTSELSE